jgi:hypothetical protein
MWNVFKRSSNERGGFQNSDIGKSAFNTDDMGPDFGPDYARFSDSPDVTKDSELRSKILNSLFKTLPDIAEDTQIIVRNGFVFIKVYVERDYLREDLKEIVLKENSVRDVVVQFLH